MLSNASFQQTFPVCQKKSIKDSPSEDTVGACNANNKDRHNTFGSIHNAQQISQMIQGSKRILSALESAVHIDAIKQSDWLTGCKFWLLLQNPEIDCCSPSIRCNLIAGNQVGNITLCQVFESCPCPPLSVSQTLSRAVDLHWITVAVIGR